MTSCRTRRLRLFSVSRLPLPGACPGMPMCIWRACAPSTWSTDYGRPGFGDTARAAETPTVTKQPPRRCSVEWSGLPNGRLSVVVTIMVPDDYLGMCCICAKAAAGPVRYRVPTHPMLAHQSAEST